MAGLRLLLLAGSIPLILVVALLLKLPESTQYLITRHQQGKAQRILENIQGHSFQEPVKLVLTQSETASDENPVKVVLGKISVGFKHALALLLYQSVGVLSFNKLDANDFKNSRF